MDQAESGNRSKEAGERRECIEHIGSKSRDLKTRALGFYENLTKSTHF